VYSATDRKSFENIDSWLSQIQQHASQTVAKVLVANKCDEESERVVSYEEGKALADKFGIPFFECSARTASNVNEAYTTLVEEVMDIIPEDQRRPGVKLPEAKGKKGDEMVGMLIPDIHSYANANTRIYASMHPCIHASMHNMNICIHAD
jgi:GTPase SAR1 family protein